MKRRLAVLCLLAAPLVAHAQSAPEWQAVVGPELRFRFEMPTPVEKSTASEKEKGHASLRIGWTAKLDGQMFDFDFVDYEDGWFSTRDTKVMSKELGRGDAEKAFPKDRYKYVRDELVGQQGWDGYALDIEASDGALVMMRTYIVKDRLYRLLVTAKADPKTREAANRFLDSFKVAEARP